MEAKAIEKVQRLEPNGKGLRGPCSATTSESRQSEALQR
jgi:hypothetical protein